MVHLLNISLILSLLTRSAKIPKSVSTKPRTAKIMVVFNNLIEEIEKVYSAPNKTPVILLATQYRYPAAKIEQAG